MMYHFSVLLTIVTFFRFFFYGLCTEDNCRSIPTVANFDINSITGLWYAYETNDPATMEGKCMSYDLKATGDGNIVVTKSFKSGSNFETFDLNIYLVTGSQFKSDLPEFRDSYSTLIAREEGFCVWYLCLPRASKDFIFILTKQRNPDDSIVKEAYNFLTKAGFDVISNPLPKVDQSDC